MSTAEVGHRLLRALQTRIESAGLLSARSVPEPRQTAHFGRWLPAGSIQFGEGYRSAAGQLLAGRLRIFALPLEWPLESRQWNLDPSSGRIAPLAFGKRLDYRNQELVGDVKYLWEANRHLELVTLAQAVAATGDERYQRGMRSYLESWLEQCPYPLGANWTSSLELGIRLINWSLAWQLIGDAESPLFADESGQNLRERWLRSIYQHVHFISHYYSRFSSANNHLIGEAAGVFIASRTWPFWREFEQWGKAARDILIAEAEAQNHTDGVNREQAISYQQFVLDFLILAGIADRANGNKLPAKYWGAVEQMIEFIRSVMDVNGNVPMFGDADDGYVVRLSQEPDFCPYRSLLATGAILFDRPDFAAKAGRLDDKTRMLVDTARWDELLQRGQTHAKPPRRDFPDGGYYLLGRELNTRSEVRLIADAGPLGYLSIAAHGHADALAFVLSIAGREILVDPGTYAYHTKPVWRQFFRSTGAHNTIRVDGLDQSVQGGNFMWLQHATARCLEFKPSESGGLFAGEHDGYRRLPDPLTHRREIRMSANVIEVTDRLLCCGPHRAERAWHFSEHCRVSLNGDSVVAEHGPVRVTLYAAEPVREIRRLRGSEDPPGGWVSRRFDVKVPSDSVYFVSDIRGDTELITRIEWEFTGLEHAHEN